MWWGGAECIADFGEGETWPKKLVVLVCVKTFNLRLYRTDLFAMINNINKCVQSIALPLPHPCLMLLGKVRVNFTLLVSSHLVSCLSSRLLKLAIYSEIIYNFTEHKDNNLKLSGYDPWGPPRSSRASRMIISFMSPVRNPQCPPSTPLLDPHSWHTSNKDINTKLSG